MSDHRNDSAWLLLTVLAWVAQVLYFISPIDLVPDILPVVGWADDILAFVVTLCVTGVGAYKLWQKRPQLDAGRQLEGARYGAEAYEPLSTDQIRAL